MSHIKKNEVLTKLYKLCFDMSIFLLYNYFMMNILYPSERQSTLFASTFSNLVPGP